MPKVAAKKIIQVVSNNNTINKEEKVELTEEKRLQIIWAICTKCIIFCRL